MAGRNTLLTPELHKAIVDSLTLGCPIVDACQHVGITETTFYNWRNRGQAELARLEEPKARERQSEAPFVKFFEDTTRAQAEARRAAVASIRQAYGLRGITTENVTTKTVSETKLRKKRLPDGTVVEEPYTWTRTETTKTVSQYPSDWRAAMEFLKRRDKENWSDKIVVSIEDLRQKAIEDIRAGRLTYEALAAEDKSLADELFASAGVPIETGTRQSQ